MMGRINFAPTSGVVDVSREHGAWFGFGELQRVVEFIGRGGLPRAITRMQEESFRRFLRAVAGGDPVLAVFAPVIPEGGG